MFNYVWQSFRLKCLSFNNVYSGYFRVKPMKNANFWPFLKDSYILAQHWWWWMRLHRRVPQIRIFNTNLCKVKSSLIMISGKQSTCMWFGLIQHLNNISRVESRSLTRQREYNTTHQQTLHARLPKWYQQHWMHKNTKIRRVEDFVNYGVSAS